MAGVVTDEISHATAHEATTRFTRVDGSTIPTIQKGRGQHTLNRVAFLVSSVLVTGLISLDIVVYIQSMGPRAQLGGVLVRMTDLLRLRNGLIPKGEKR